MTLTDQIIDHGPYMLDLSFTAEQANQLRDELLELRKLRTAAERRERIAVDTLIGAEDEPDSLYLFHDRNGCRWDFTPDAPADLAELVRRADQHTEDCRG